MKTVTVLGALGAQGGSVVASLIADGSFKIRAVTRSVDSDAAKALQEKGVEVVAGDTKKPESLTGAFTGADAAFIVVNFWDPEIMKEELELTKQILDVAKKCDVAHILYANLANVEAVSEGKLDVPHFTMKAQAFDYAKSLDFKYVTAVEAAFYYTNWFTFFKPSEEDGTLVWKFPGKGKISQYNPRADTGPATVAAVKDPEAYNGKFLLLEGNCLTPEECVAAIGKKLGKPTRVDFVEPKVFETFFPGAHEIAEMVSWFDEYAYYGPETKDRKTESGKQAAGALQSFEVWLDTKEYEKLMA
jgi:uncharacterized protein YbjT (DUF2867 family)